MKLLCSALAPPLGILLLPIAPALLVARAEIPLEPAPVALLPAWLPAPDSIGRLVRCAWLDSHGAQGRLNASATVVGDNGEWHTEPMQLGNGEPRTIDLDSVAGSRELNAIENLARAGAQLEAI